LANNNPAFALLCLELSQLIGLFDALGEGFEIEGFAQLNEGVDEDPHTYATLAKFTPVIRAK